MVISNIHKIIIVFLTILNSCQPTKPITPKEIIGTYKWESHVGAKIILNQDKTFLYHWWGGLLWGKTKGKWRLDKNKLILHSEKQPDEVARIPTFTIIPQANTDKKQFRITILDVEDNSKLPYATCRYMKNDLMVYGTASDSNGVITSPYDDTIDKLVVLYTGYETVEIPINSLTSNHFILKLKKENRYYKYFTNQKWKVKNGRLYSPDVKRDKYNPKPYFERVLESQN